MFRVAVVVSFCCLTLWLESTAAAQQSRGAAPPPGYDAAVETALQEFEAGNYAEARSQLFKAHSIFPNARTLRALGKAEYELKNYREAIDYLEQALVSNVRPMTAEQRAEAQRLISAARGYTASYRISLQPPDSRLVLDGNAVKLGADGLLVVNVGDHVLQAEADGYVPERRELRVIGGGAEQSLRIELQKIPAEPEPAALPAVELTESEQVATEPPVQSDTTPLRRKWWFWTGVAGVLAGGAVAAVLLTREPPASRGSGGSSGVDIRL